MFKNFAPTRNIRSRVWRQVGASLIEIQVSLAVMAFGLLGVAGLLSMEALGHIQSNARSAASGYARDILDRMRANAANARAGQYNLPISKLPHTGASLADQDLQQWRSSLTRGLQAGTGSVAVDKNTGLATVTLQWTEKNLASNGAPQTLSVTFKAQL